MQQTLTVCHTPTHCQRLLQAAATVGRSSKGSCKCNWHNIMLILSTVPIAVFRWPLLKEKGERKGEIWQKRGREGGEGERGEGGGKGRRGKGRGGKGRAPMTVWHGAPNVLIRPWAPSDLLAAIEGPTVLLRGGRFQLTGLRTAQPHWNTKLSGNGVPNSSHILLTENKHMKFFVI